MTVTEASVDKPFSTRGSGHCCSDGVVAAPSPDLGRMLHSRVEALLDERDGPFAKWTKIQTLRASRAHGCMYLFIYMYVPVHISIYSRVQSELRQMSRRFCDAQGDQRVFCMVGAWEIIHTMLGIGTRSGLYKRFLSTYQWQCHAKLKYQLAGIFPFRVLNIFLLFCIDYNNQTRRTYQFSACSS